MSEQFSEKSNACVQEGHFVVPDSIETERVWIVYSQSDRGKVPCSPHSLKPKYVDGADPDESELVTFSEALNAVARSREKFGHDNGLSGVMLALSAHEELASIDLDDCVDPKTGEMDDIAAELVSDMSDTYWECSPSGTGLHGYVFDELGLDDEYKKKDENGIEVYTDRGMTFTGRHVSTTCTDIAKTPGLVGAYQRRYNDEKKASDSVATYTATDDVAPVRAPTGLSSSQKKLVDMMVEHDDEARLLFEEGDTAWTNWQNDRSRADMALASKLNWWAHESGALSDEEYTESELIEIFLSSDLARRDKCSRSDYVRRTIHNAR